MRHVKFLIIAGVLVVPYLASAQLTGGIVPCGGTGQPACNACHVVDLATNIVEWLITIAVLIAVGMFSYAGFLMVTAGGDEGKISQAKKIFSTVFIGLIITLAAWLIVDTVMKTLFDESKYPGFGPWNKIECVEQPEYAKAAPRPDTPPDVVPGPDILDGPDSRTQAQKDADEKAARAALIVAGKIDVNKDWCDVNERYQDHVGGCTDLSLVNAATIQAIRELQEGCNCRIVVTGGSELGHAGTGPGTHEGGDKYDVRPDPRLNGYLFSKDFKDATIGGRRGKLNTVTGDFFVNEGTHWDVLVM